MTKQELQEENNLLREYIIQMHGPEVLDRLKLEYAVQKTNDALSLEYRTDQYRRMEHAIYQLYQLRSSVEKKNKKENTTVV